MIIDYHAHTFPEALAPRALDALSGRSHLLPFVDGTDRMLAESMKKNGIDRSVVLSVATSPAQVTGINDSAARRMEERERLGLIAYGAMHPDYADYHSELKRIKELGFPGIKLHPVYQGADLDDIRLLRIYDRCAELGLAVVLHGGFDIGFPGVKRCSPQMALHALRELKAVRADRAGREDSDAFPEADPAHPGFRFVLAHMGGWLEWEDVLRLAPEMLEAGPVYLDTAFSLGRFRPLTDGYWKESDTAMLSDRLFVRIVRAYGPGRILFGTDSPWSDQGETIRHLRSLSLIPEELRTILEAK